MLTTFLLFTAVLVVALTVVVVASLRFVSNGSFELESAELDEHGKRYLEGAKRAESRAVDYDIWGMADEADEERATARRCRKRAAEHRVKVNPFDTGCEGKDNN
jgi:hypothetical protein